jgi:DNA (cytosine-5)-methyltransferase 1
MRSITASDLFCGAGGFSSGLLQACGDLNRRAELLAVNHWPEAIATHALNHQDVRHLCENLDNVDPRKLHPGGKLDILLASPECTHHSNARGGKPMSDQSRASAWHVVRWAEALRIEDIIIENVREFQTWGPLDKKGRPIKNKKGELFRAWLHCFEAMGYKVDFQLLNAADYGGATSRQRLFVVASKRRRPRWPERTHSATAELFTENRHRAAREIIDWDLEGNSIFGRKKPLAPKTLARIMAGMKKFNGCEFVIGQQSCAAPRSIDEPVPTLSTACAVSLVQPFIVPVTHSRGFSRAHSIDAPLPTLTCAKGGEFALARPFFVVFRRNQDAASMDNPLPTLTTSGANFGVCEPFIVKFHGDHAGRDESAQRVYSVDEPLRTLDTANRFGLAEPYLVKYYGNSDVADLAEPLDTVTTNDRFGLAQPEPIAVFERDGETWALMDIKFRMLEPHECAAAMGMTDYQFPKVLKKTKKREWYADTTKKDKMKMIGNAVSVECARALCRSVLA